MGLSERMASAPVHHGHVAGQLGRQLGPRPGVRDSRTVDAVQFQSVQRDQRHVRKGECPGDNDKDSSITPDGERRR